MALVRLFSDHIRIEIPGCLDELIDRMVRSAVIEFCRETDAWSYVHEDIPVTSGLSTYELFLPANTVVHRVLSMENSVGDPVEEKSQVWLTDNVSQWRVGTGSAIDYITFTEGAAFQATPIPNATIPNGLSGIVLSLLPSITAESVGDVLADRYFETICFGAKARLFSMAGVSWSDSAMALQQRTWFDNGMKKAGNKFVVNKKSTFRPTSYAKKNVSEDDGL